VSGERRRPLSLTRTSIHISVGGVHYVATLAIESYRGVSAKVVVAAIKSSSVASFRGDIGPKFDTDSQQMAFRASRAASVPKPTE
jgi:hypothetical protein